MMPPTWRKSSRSSGGTSGECIEVATLAGAIGIRDSKSPHGGHLNITPAEFAALLDRIKSNDPHLL